MSLYASSRVPQTLQIDIGGHQIPHLKQLRVA
jgi:hypothetical protein